MPQSLVGFEENKLSRSRNWKAKKEKDAAEAAESKAAEAADSKPVEKAAKKAEF